MESWPSVSVIISAAAAQKSLPDALQAIAEQDYPGEIEVVVAAADQPTAQVAKDHGVIVIDNPSRHTPVGLNLAARASTGAILVRIDAHSVIPSDYIRRMVDSLMRTNADNVGGRQVPVGTTLMEEAIAAAMTSRLGAGDARYRIGGEPGPTDTVYLGAFRRSVFDRLGGFDERFLRNQDYEFNHRIRASGGVVWFDPEIAVNYRPRSSLPALASQYFQYGRWKRFFARSHDWSLRPRQWAPPLLVVALVGSVIGSIWWKWLLVVPVLYLLELIAIGVASLPRVGAPALLMPVALVVMHISWGIGFLLGQTRVR
ncbi:MAG TPA: glycosyltransferase family 2 protein [Acidimicrobiia bacterium]|nr:glycosyltransferase family 2 protein [Acidimicrobiia bacterium]